MSDKDLRLPGSVAEVMASAQHLGLTKLGIVGSEKFAN